MKRLHERAFREPPPADQVGLKKSNGQKSGQNGANQTKSLTSTRVAIVGIFSALTVGVGYALVFVPNVELFSVSVFLSGYLFGAAVGASVGTASSLVFAYFNPLGASHPVLYATQVASYALLGVIGAAARRGRTLGEISSNGREPLAMAAVGAVSTFGYDLATTLGQYLPLVGWKPALVWPYYVFGLSFTLVHLICNTVAFGCLVPVVASSLAATNWAPFQAGAPSPLNPSEEDPTRSRK
ncbi:MAG: hypothetical protein Kow0069_00570 [Promethearchaeota archaeon]